MKLTQSILSSAAIAGALLLASAAGASEKDECTPIDKQLISISYSSTISVTQDAGAIFAEKLALFEKVAKELKLEDYEITSRDISSYRSGGYSLSDGAPSYETSISLGASFIPNTKAFDAYLKQSKADSVSSYITKHCKEG